MSPYKFNLGQQAEITVSGETGQIIGRAEYITGTNCYFVRYQCADGRAVEAWWNEDALTASEKATAPAPATFQRLLQWAAEDLADPAICGNADRLELERQIVTKRLAPHIEQLVELAWRQLQQHQVSDSSSKSAP